MTIFHLDIKSISRAAGRSAPAAAAYRAGEKIRDQRTGKLHNYSRRTDVTHREILLPGHFGSQDAQWARDRTQLWNRAEAAERRRNSRIAREYQVSLPHELSVEQRRDLARRFAQELADRHNVAIDLAIHDPRPDGDPRNFHAHLLATSREVGATGFGTKAGLDIPYEESLQRGLAGNREMMFIRERWAAFTNDAFAAAGLDLRVDPRSLNDQGIDREPQPTIPFQLWQMERRGMPSVVAERIRARYRERVAARAARSLGQELPSSVEAPERGRELPDSDAFSVEDIRRRAREEWVASRREAEGVPAAGQSRSAQFARATSEKEHEQSGQRAPAADEDLAL